MSTKRIRNLRGLRVSDPSDLAESLHLAGGAKLARAVHLGKRTVVLTLNWQGEIVRFTADITEVLQAAIPEYPMREERPHERKRALTDEQARAARELREAGMTANAIAARFGVCRALVSHLTSDAPALRTHRMRDVDLDRLAELRATGLSIKEASRQLGVSSRTVFSRLRQRDLNATSD